MMDYSDQLPPPARPEARAPLPKSNADFRAFLDTPRPSRGGDETRNQNGSGEPSGAQKKKAKKPFKPKQEEEKVEEDEGPKYRSSPLPSPPPPSHHFLQPVSPPPFTPRALTHLPNIAYRSVQCARKSYSKSPACPSAQGPCSRAKETGRWRLFCSRGVLGSASTT